MKPEIGATTKPNTTINWLGLRIRGEASSSRKRSKAPLCSKPLESTNKPTRVIRAGLPKPAKASLGVSTPVAIKRPAAKRATSSGASQPPMKQAIANPNSSKVTRALKTANDSLS